MLRAVWSPLLLAITFAACSGEIDAPGPGKGDQQDDPPPPSPEGEGADTTNDDPLCGAAFKLTGTWTASAPLQPPEDDEWYEDCWPAGTWTFTATLDDMGEVIDADGDGNADRCGSVANTVAPELAPKYSFKVVREADIDNFGTPNDPSDDAMIGWKDSLTILSGADAANVIMLKISGDGPTGCEGMLDVDDATHTQGWAFRADLEGTTLTGRGEYTLYKGAQR